MPPMQLLFFFALTLVLGCHQDIPLDCDENHKVSVVHSETSKMRVDYDYVWRENFGASSLMINKSKKESHLK